MMLNSNLCRAQFTECLLLAIEKPDDSATLSRMATGGRSWRIRSTYAMGGNPTLIPRSATG